MRSLAASSSAKVSDLSPVTSASLSGKRAAMAGRICAGLSMSDPDRGRGGPAELRRHPGRDRRYRAVGRLGPASHEHEHVLLPGHDVEPDVDAGATSAIGEALTVVEQGF